MAPHGGHPFITAYGDCQKYAMPFCNLTTLCTEGKTPLLQANHNAIYDLLHVDELMVKHIESFRSWCTRYEIGEKTHEVVNTCSFHETSLIIVD